MRRPRDEITVAATLSRLPPGQDRSYVTVLPRLPRLERTVSLAHAVDTALREFAHHRTVHQRWLQRSYLVHRSGG